MNARRFLFDESFVPRPLPSSASHRAVPLVWLLQASEGGWLVLAGSHGWLHGDRRAALADAHWLAWNLGLAVREVVA